MVYAWIASLPPWRFNRETDCPFTQPCRSHLFDDRHLGRTFASYFAPLQDRQDHPRGRAWSSRREDGHAHHGRRDVHPAGAVVQRIAQCRGVDRLERQRGGAFGACADGCDGGFAILGAVDDWEGIRGKRKGDGMRARTKFAFQVILALVTAYVLKYRMDVPDLYFPGLFFEIELGWLYVPIAAFIIVAESNAMNFTDGLDGLAGLDRRHCHRRFWRHCPDSGTDLSGAFLFHSGWRALWLFVV